MKTLPQDPGYESRLPANAAPRQDSQTGMGRRGFLKGTVAASAAGVAPFNILKAGPSPNSKVNIACVGVGGMGGNDANALAAADNVNVVALCDVHESWHRKKSARYKENLGGIKLWKDYRVMFDKIGKDIDAIYTGTPEHVHYAVCMFGMKRGKHVFAQKPLCRTVNEARILTEEAGKSRVVTQMGNQGHSTEATAVVRDWVQGGCIGKVRKVIGYSRKNYCTLAEPAAGGEIPEDLEWDLFLNRAEAIPFSPSYINREWIRYSHFSGIVGDMGSHLLDPACYALDPGPPLSVMAELPETYPPGWLARPAVIPWEFAARGEMPPVTMKYYLGPDIPYPRPEHLEEGRDTWFMKSGSALIGEESSIMTGESFNPARIFPEAAMKATRKPPKAAYRRKGSSHLQNWVRAIQGEDKAMSSFDVMGPFSEMLLLGDVAAMNPGRKLQWDHENMRITNDEEADKCAYMRRPAPRDDMNWT